MQAINVVNQSVGLASQTCPQCDGVARVRRRNFSAQVWSVLHAWGEVTDQAIDEPICEECYNDLREILIDRADEVDEAIRTGVIKEPEIAVKKISKTKNKKAATPSQKKKSAKKSTTANGRKKRSKKVA